MGIFFDGMFGGKEIIKSNCNTPEPKKGLEKLLNSKEEISSDISDAIGKTDMNMCISNGVVFHDIPGMIDLTYNGILAKSGAQQIFAVIGYGSNEQWEDMGYFPMQKTAQQTFEMTTFRKRTGRVNVAFKDDAGNWDNNSGLNYSFVQG